jgi:hypothetical protein
MRLQFSLTMMFAEFLKQKLDWQDFYPGCLRGKY